MPALPETLYTAAQVRELDYRAVQDAGIPAAELMQRAGKAAWQLLTTQWPGAQRVLVLCGAGNNAGDGYVVATLALMAKLPAAAAEMRNTFLKAGGGERAFDGKLPEADVVVDGLLGTGLDRPLVGNWLAAVQAVNASRLPVLSLDIPSGLDADTGAEQGTAVRAAVTVTFIGLKSGLFTGAGPECVGQLRFEDLGLPASMYTGLLPRARRLRSAAMREHLLPRRARNAHKGDFGHVLIVGGDHGMGGAARLAAEAALRCGAGLVSIATRREHVQPLLTALPEAMTHAVESPGDLATLLARVSIVVIGPGLGQGEWGRAMLPLALNSPLPLLMDADALNLLARAPRKREHWVLTPHPGEAGRLLETDTTAVQRDRYAAVEDLAGRYNAVAVLKGAGSLVAAPGELTSVCTAGNPGMAAPGMGDLLTGVIAALMAQRLALPDAVRAGVYLHAAAGDLAARQGERGMLARDLLEPLRQLVNA